MAWTADKAAERVRNRNGGDIFLYAAAHFAKERASSFAREGTGSKRRAIVFEEKPHNFS